MASHAPRSVIAALDDLVQKYHLLKHPFYQAWKEGKLTRDSLALYAEQYYQHVRAFPDNLRMLAERTDGDLRKIVEENLAEEVSPAMPHPLLWRQFAGALGVSRESLDGARPLPGIAALLDTFDELVAYETPARAVAALYAYESQVPEISTEKIRGLQSFYGIEDSAALAYFAVHEEADVRHSAAWRGWLARQPEEDALGILCSAERALKALWGALDAVTPHACAAAANN